MRYWHRFTGREHGLPLDRGGGAVHTVSPDKTWATRKGQARKWLSCDRWQREPPVQGRVWPQAQSASQEAAVTACGCCPGEAVSGGEGRGAGHRLPSPSWC